MIYFIVGGGLGNQMFQYSFLKSFLNDNKRNDDIVAIMHHNKNEDRREYSLKNLSIKENMHVVDENDMKIKMFFYKVKKKVLFAYFKMLNISKEKRFDYLLNYNIIFSFDTYKYIKDIKVQGKDIYIEGAFQSWKYFDRYKQDIKKELQVSAPQSKENERIFNEILNSNSVCVHIRRGDYLNSRYSKSLLVCNEEYYIKAMDYINKKLVDPTFYIFSTSKEDINWIKNNYSLDKFNVKYIELENPDYEELRLMYTCKHFVISNSTFSWWAQYLSDYKEKIVIAPKRWTNTDLDFSDLYMDNWTLM